LRDAFQKFRLRVIAQLGPAKTPQVPELSGEDVKKTGNGGIALPLPITETKCGSEPARDEASTFNNDVE
jgi:hypothetical protein